MIRVEKQSRKSGGFRTIHIYKCNLARGNRYTYEEWFGMTEFFRRSK